MYAISYTYFYDYNFDITIRLLSNNIEFCGVVVLHSGIAINCDLEILRADPFLQI